MGIFGTAGIRGRVNDQVSPQLALRVGQAVGADADQIVLGRDGRTTGAALLSAVRAGAASVGTTVRDAGIVPTPTLAYASQGRHGIMVTASHNPPSDNGIKVFVDGVEANEAFEASIEQRVARDPISVPWDRWTTPITESVISRYRAHVIDYTADIGTEPAGLAVAHDAGTGMAGGVLPPLLTDIKVDVSAVNANPDGHFPARQSKPTPESLEAFKSFVQDGKFDLGLAHDGDADRIAVIDASGELIHEDTILAILAEYYVRTSESHDPVVVTTPNASSRVDDRVNDRGGRVERCPLGSLHEGIDRVASTGGPDTEVVFAGEPWKHIHPACGGWIDGIVSAVILCRLAAGPGGLNALREPIDERPYRKANVACPDERKTSVMESLKPRLSDRFSDAEIDSQYGLRIERDDGSWVLVRPSGTEPYIRIYVEAEDVHDLTQTVVDIIESTVRDP